MKILNVFYSFKQGGVERLGMTYHEDVAAVKGSFKEMLENGVYKADLFSDL